MKDFMEGYALIIELFLYAYNDQLDRGYSPDEALKISRTIVEIILNINNKSQEDK